MRVIPQSHKEPYNYREDNDYYHFTTLSHNDICRFNINVGEFILARQRLVHSGGISTNSCIAVGNCKLPYTHLSLHIDFWLVDHDELQNKKY